MDTIIPIKPVRLDMHLSGGQPAHNVLPELTTPTRCLLLKALQQPMTAREAAAAIGIPTMLAEQEIDALAALEAVVRLLDGDWATDFFIEPLDFQARCQALAAAHAPVLRAELLRQFNEMLPALKAIGFDTGGKTVEALAPVLMLHLMHDGGEYTGWNPPLRPDGQRYYFLCHEIEDKPKGLLISDWYGTEHGLQYRTCVPGDASVMARVGASADKVCAACRKARETERLDGEDPEFVAGLIAAGVIRNEGGRFSVAVPWFTKAQRKAFEALAKTLGAAMAKASEAVLAELTRLLGAAMPRHLSGQRPLYAMFGLFDVMAGIMQGVWPDDLEPAAGLMLVES